MLEAGPKFTDPPVTALTKLSLKHRKTCENKLNSVGSSDLSSDEVEDIGQLREERRDRKRQKRKDKLKKCCSGCDEDLTLGDTALTQAALPSPLEVNNGERPSEVIAPFESVLSAVCDSEEEIDAQIEAYSSVGLRLARGDDGLSDVEQPMNEYYPACGTPSSDSDVVTTHISNSVGKKLAKTRSRNSNRTDSHTSSVLDADFDFEGEGDMWDGGFDYQDELSDVDEAGDSLYRKSVAAYEPGSGSGSKPGAGEVYTGARQSYV